MSQLDIQSGKPQRTRPDDAAFVKDLYTCEDRQMELSRSVEAFFSIVERHAAPALARLREDPDALSPQDRETIAFFLAFQESRTPAGLIRSERMRQAAFEIQASVDLSSPKSFRRAFKSDVTQSMSPEELEAMRERMQKQLLEGRVGYESPRTGALTQILKAANDIASEVYSLDWTVLTADGGEFITSDRPISMVDPTPEHPWTGNAWRSSGNAISFYPLSSTKGLFMTPGDHGLAMATSRASQVRRLNLMTYGWAERFVYGTSQEAVVRVRRQARSHPAEVAKRRPFKQVILVPADMLDRSVTAEYVQRGWPEGFLVDDDDGQRHLMGYVVVGLDEPAGAAARAATKVTDALAGKVAKDPLEGAA